MRVLIACEFSGIVRRAFAQKGHDAWSCDILPAEDNDPHHFQENVLQLLDLEWDLMIAHPPCTHLSKAGAWCWKYKVQEQADALVFVQQLLQAPISSIALENPVGKINTSIRKPDQIVHPYHFGDPWMKETCLWLKNLPPLQPTNQVEPQGNWVKPGNNRPHRRFNSIPEGGKGNAKDRSRTFPGMASAMAEQWG